jgi:predicted KAP-like P-loop ATPase
VSSLSNSLPTISILTDDIEDNPIHDFEKYADTIVKMVMGSKPRFSVGIYGEWGTGKTTLMRLIEKKLRSNENILTVWFNAWRYEREDQFALVALMKTAYAMGDLPRYEEIKKVLLRGIGIIGKDVLRNLALRYAMTEKGLKDLEEKLLPKLDLLSSIDRDTIYFDGLRKIEEEMEKISKANNYNNNRIIIFIDDLDRCSPKTTLEAFESIKVFLGLEGFIYVVGLSHETISKLVSSSYKDSDIKGEHYLRKVIQIPITIPDWNDAEVIQDLVHNLSTSCVLLTISSYLLKFTLIAK